MKTIAATRKVDEAIDDFGDALADLSSAAAEFLQQVHEGLVPHARAAAEEHLYALHALLGQSRIGARPPSWSSYVTTWRAVARLAGSELMYEIDKAG